MLRYTAMFLSCYCSVIVVSFGVTVGSVIIQCILVRVQSDIKLECDNTVLSCQSTESHKTECDNTVLSC